MATVQDKDIAIWVCPHGYTHDLIEFPVGSAEPNAKVCGAHGEPYVKRCPNQDCPSPIYHPSDLDENYHKPCGAGIPWANERRANAQALMEHDAFNSTLLGRDVPELTPEERQDVITPPSGRLPAERVQLPRRKKDPPKVTPTRGTYASDLPDRWTDLLKQGGPPVRKSQQVWTPPPPMKFVKKPWWRRLGAWIVSNAWIVMLSAVGSLIAAYIWWVSGIGASR
jgi:hypothetical protein